MINPKNIAWPLIFFLLTSCSKMPTAFPVPIQTRDRSCPIETKTVELLPTYTFTTTPTKAKAFSTSSPSPISPSIFSNPRQFTDGILQISIEESDKKCHSPGAIVFVKIKYQNLSDENVTIVDFDIVSVSALIAFAQVVPVLTNSKNERIQFTDPYASVIADNLTSPLLKQISPKSFFEVLAEYRLPSELVEYYGNQQPFTSPLPAGQYLLKFVYIAHGYESAWEGEISSNQIGICVTDK